MNPNELRAQADKIMDCLRSPEHLGWYVLLQDYAAYLHEQADQMGRPRDGLTWLYTHCRAIGMTCKSDSGRWEDDIALFTTELQKKANAHAPAPQSVPEGLRDAAQNALTAMRLKQQVTMWANDVDSAQFRAALRGLEAALAASPAPAEGANWQPVPPRACINPTHEAADAFWRYWREHGETHKHGYYESTWGAINAALAFGCALPVSYAGDDSAPAPQSVPVGYALVPLEPTREMWEAGAAHVIQLESDDDERSERDIKYTAIGRAVAVYKDMIAASPAAPAAPAPAPCIGGNPSCPCQDGDICHYRDSADGTKGWPIPAPADVDLHRLISGALFDFAGYLTTRDNAVTLGSCHNAAPAADLLVAWAATRKLSLDDPLVQTWNAALATADQTRQPMAEGYGNAATERYYGITAPQKGEPKCD